MQDKLLQLITSGDADLVTQAGELCLMLSPPLFNPKLLDNFNLTKLKGKTYQIEDIVFIRDKGLYFFMWPRPWYSYEELPLYRSVSNLAYHPSRAARSLLNILKRVNKAL